MQLVSPPLPSPLHVLRQQVETAFCFCLKYKCVNKDIFWTLNNPNLGNMMHVQYNINSTLKYLGLHDPKRKKKDCPG
jgi:hypothetical protein